MTGATAVTARGTDGITGGADSFFGASAAGTEAASVLNA
jgi:hypothetical protein